MTPLSETLISSGADMVGGLLGGLFNESRSQTMWKKQADYNSPVKQMERLKLAGLNPNLVYGNGSAVNTMSQAPEGAKVDFSNEGKKGLEMYVASSQLEMQKDINALQQMLLQSQIDDKRSLINFRDNIQTPKMQSDMSFTQTALEEKKKLMSWIDSDKQIDQKLKGSQIFKTNLDSSKIQQEIEAFPVRLQNEILETRARVRNLNAQSDKITIEREMLKLAKSMRDNGIETHDNILLRMFNGVLSWGKNQWSDMLEKINWNLNNK